jgi:hypothetical protein
VLHFDQAAAPGWVSTLPWGDDSICNDDTMTLMPRPHHSLSDHCQR